MRLVVTGAGGMLGARVAEEAREGGHDVMPLLRLALDIRDADACRDVVTGADAVINCAAWTDVDGAEADEEAATAVNGDGAGNVARAAAATGARVVHVSTDYVFDGMKQTPWNESDPVSPLGAYGRSKLEGERQVAASGASHAIARTAWLFGAGGRNFVDTMLGVAAERDEVRVVTDQVGSPTWTGHLAPALIELAQGDGDGVFHVAGGGACSWHDLAVAAFELAGVSCRVDETTTAEFPRPAPRPAYSVLGSERDGPRLPDWREGVAAHVRARMAA